jgi:hypothetical protein
MCGTVQAPITTFLIDARLTWIERNAPAAIGLIALRDGPRPSAVGGLLTRHRQRPNDARALVTLDNLGTMYSIKDGV